ncbi:PH domain leucine-rich repeat-containing protein phosphatase 2 [Danaus plexippus plexippus]|uniref:PH domain leucine-rich repeat-containing protein phosphatase 2 n=1 Tax=Danaus plexippus plexippus TaxID=278856 RepID=A0A212ESM7_DANPL|nr:PH domain leucine-rich repeat-containing protein phosphatase 2 [Danaus plexippus plexippus]
MVCDDGLTPSPLISRKSLRRLASTRGFKPRSESTWIRVFDGLEPYAVDAPSKLVKVSPYTTVEDINKKLGFNEELTLWVQIGGENSRRLELNEFPFQIQEKFLINNGWKSEARRQRLAVDPELRHSLRWCAGPSSRSGGVLRSGTVYVLKGHVFPQWKPRQAHIIGSQLHTHGVSWDMLELSGGSIEMCQPKAQKLVLCVKLLCQGNGVLDTGVNHLFLGFNTIWERNMWCRWLKESNKMKCEDEEIDSLDVFSQENEDVFLDSLEPATYREKYENSGTQSTQPPNVLDLSGGGRSCLPVALNQHASDGFAVKVLRMRSNTLPALPPQTCNLIALTHLDVSDNKIIELPKEISHLTQLEEINVSNNEIKSLDCLLRLPRLRTVVAARNLITQFGVNDTSQMGFLEENKSEYRAPLTNVDLRYNKLKGSIILGNYEHLVTLDVSQNSIEVLVLSSLRGLRELYAAHNSIQHLALHGASLRVLHAPYNNMENLTTMVPPINLVEMNLTYNKLSSLPQWISGCSDLTKLFAKIEELVLSGNSLSKLPDNLPQMNNIKIVRAHSNRLRSVPMFACSASVKILDFAHNELDSIDLRLLAPKQLKFLDISCNKKLQMNPSQFNAYKCQRPLSLVDVTGQHGNSLSQKNNFHEELSGGTPWVTGFSECPNKKLLLSCAQIRLPSFCNKEGLFAIIDGETDIEVPRILQSCLPGLLLEEKSIKETVNEYMKYVILAAHRELKQKGQTKGACLVMCHLSPISTPDNSFGQSIRRYNIRLANVGNTKAVLSRRNGPLCLGIDDNKRLGYSSRYPVNVPDPDIIQTVIKEDDEFLILGNAKFWESVTVDTAISEVRAERNPVLAAKRLQDLAQSYGIEDCISVVIVRFDTVRSDVDLLMRELRHTINTNKPVCNPDCCCSRLEPCCHSISPPKSNSDRSSPSGQSDRPSSETVSHQHYASVRSHNRASERKPRGGVARAIRVRVEEDKETEKIIDDVPSSDEQFKCWEYMLEQNTQMIFDKELDNLSKGIKSNSSSLRNLKGLSGSSPQLHLNTKQTKLPFLSKHFGSARSFGSNIKPEFRFGSGRMPNGGPNAAYFGSLQRLMPYHLEYDFAVIQEKQTQSQDSLDLEGRMQQYWGVATTEL